MYCENTSTAVSGMVAADRDRGAQTLIGVTGRHSHVHHDDVRLVLVHRCPQVLGVADGGNDLMPAIGQNLGQARPDYC